MLATSHLQAEAMLALHVVLDFGNNVRGVKDME